MRTLTIWFQWLIWFHHWPMRKHYSFIILYYSLSWPVKMKWIAHFTVDIRLLNKYWSDLAHLSYLYRLVIEMYKSERWAKIIKKWRTSSEPTKFAQFLVVSVRKYMVKKYLISDRYDFGGHFFFAFCYNFVRDFS